MDADPFLKENHAWRQFLEDNFRDENRWLALAGLYLLKNGENLFGTENPKTEGWLSTSIVLSIHLAPLQSSQPVLCSQAKIS